MIVEEHTGISHEKCTIQGNGLKEIYTHSFVIYDPTLKIVIFSHTCN